MERKILPFYMTYPYMSGVKVIGEKDASMEDIAYFEQMYPLSIKYVIREIRAVLRLVDYEGSLLYDEYPDQTQMYRLAESVAKNLQNKKWESEMLSDEELVQVRTLCEDQKLTEYTIPILFQEILQKRQCKRKNKTIQTY